MHALPRRPDVVAVVSGLAAALVLPACHGRNPAFCPDGADRDGACIVIDAPPDCYGVLPFVVCVAPPAAPRVIARVDTTAGCDEVVTVGRELCVVKGTDVDIVQRAPISGSRPLVILAANALTIHESGIVDAAGTAVVGGPGADLACDAGASTGANSTNGGGGGAGGSLGSRGGSGGSGGGTAAKGGAAAAPLGVLSVLQGGCSGTDGGDSTAGSHGGSGFGGGGVYLVAGQTLTIRGTVTASGSGGRAGTPSKGGGGGGGSGGMIVLYAPTAVVTASTQIFANGGGGGGGANGNTAGADGATPVTASAAAAGGLGQGGDGGAGAFLTTAAGTGMAAAEGGGGGGGGVGVIYILGGDLSAASLSPPPT